MDQTTRAQSIVYGISLIVAPVLMGMGTFFWNGPEVGLAGGTIQVYAIIFWIPAIYGLLSLLRPRMPRLAAWGMLMAALACVGGVNWGTDGAYAEAYAIAGAGVAQPALLEAMGPAAPLLLFIPGPIFPLAFIIIGIALLRTRAVPAWIAILLVIGGIAFPASRIPRIEMLAHLADLLLLIPTAAIGLRFLRGEGFPAVEVGVASQAAT